MSERPSARLSQQYLWREVGERADQEARFGHRRSPASSPRPPGRRPAREPEVEDLGRRLPAIRQPRSRSSSRGESRLARARAPAPRRFARHSARRSRRAGRRPGTSCDSGWPSTNSIAMNTRPSSFADLVHGADVRMREVRRRARFVEQPGALVWRGSSALGANELDRHRSVEPLVVRQVHDAHAAGPEAGLDPVLAQRFADHHVALMLSRPRSLSRWCRERHLVRIVGDHAIDAELLR